MARQRSKSGLFQKLGAAGQKAFEEHKGDDATFDSGGDLPAGIEGGIAQLVDCKFDVYKKGDNLGEYYFYAAGIVKSPAQHDGIKINGLRTSIMEPLCSTPQRTRPDIEAHLEWILNQLRILGVNTDELDPKNYAVEIEAAAAALEREQPHFRFRTWKGDATEQFPNPRVNHVWGGTCEYTDEDEGEGVVDKTGGSESDEPDESDEVDTPEDLMGIAEAADNDDDDAIAGITAAAEEVGINHEEYATWVEVAEAIGSNAPNEPDEPDEEDFEPVKGKVYSNKFPKTRKRVQVEVTAIFPGKQTCNLKRLDDGKVFKSQPWDGLEELEED